MSFRYKIKEVKREYIYKVLICKIQLALIREETNS